MDSNNGDIANISTIGTLKTFKSRRRSQSASGLPAHSTPGPRALMKMKTPNVKSSAMKEPSTHMSRLKQRTPLVQKNHQRAVSADSIPTIIPKQNPKAPVKFLRHTKPGEVVFSITGSPVVSQYVENSSFLRFSLLIWFVLFLEQPPTLQRWTFLTTTAY